MTRMTRDRCPACGAWLILAEVECVAPRARVYPDVSSRATYECPGCTGVYETWLADEDPLTEVTARRQILRNRLATRRPVQPH